MLFRVCDHYEYEYKYDGFTYKEFPIKNVCFICFEISQFDECEPVTLKTQKTYISLCHCDSYVHNGCLKIWYNKSKTCPICRKNVEEMTSINFFIKFIPYGSYICYTFTVLIKKLILNIFIILLINSFIQNYLFSYFYYRNKDFYYDLYEYNDTIEN